MNTQLKELDADSMRIAAAGVVPLPIEQSSVWESFEISQGHRLWGRLAWYENGKCCAVIALYQYRIKTWNFLWAKWGPVWLKEASPERERQIRDDLARYVAARDRSIVFIRLNAHYDSDDIRVPFQTISYDRTVFIDTTSRTPEAILEAMPKAGQRMIRRAITKAEEIGLEIRDETADAMRDFTPFYEVLQETAERDGFRPHPKEYYVALLTTIGSQQARLYVARDRRGNILCWDLVLVHDHRAQVPYGASTQTGRHVSAPALLDYRAACMLAEEGTLTFDLMGIHSPRVPCLYTVGKYKLKFSKRYTDVPGGRDFPIKKREYAMLSVLKATKDKLGRH